MMITLEPAFVRPHLENGIQFCLPPSIGKEWIVGAEFSRGPPRSSRAEELPL